MASSSTRHTCAGSSRRPNGNGSSSSVERLGREMLEMMLNDKRPYPDVDDDIELEVVDGMGAEAGHIITTAIGGRNGIPKKAVTYIAEHVIGTGSFGVVFQAKCRETGEIVAIKKVLQDKRYKNRELQIMHLLDHPNIVALKHCFFSTTNREEIYLNLVLEFVPETVNRVARQYNKMNLQMPLIYVKLYTYQICRALAYIHNRVGICHRDIKPQNLLVSPHTHQLKLCDFGSAKVLVKGEPNISYICSRYYRAPELIFGATEYTTAIDLWSTGCVMAELLLGQPLFPGESGVDQLVEIIKVLGTPTREEQKPGLMATRPGPLTEWPWQRLGGFKYVVLLPWAVPGLRMAMNAARKGEGGWAGVDHGYMMVFPSLLLRMLHNQIWISLSRFQTARSPHRILDRSLDFEQVDRERNWDDQILLNGLLFFIGHGLIPQAKNMPFWRADGAIMMALLHAGPVEFLYYWFHRALHHHFLYSRYHSHHHASIVTEPITSVIHPFAEHIVYYLLFAIPMLTTILTGTCSLGAIIGYIAYIDFMNNMGHCNFELVPKWLFRVLPPLKYLMYTPSFHSLHHTQFRTNYSLFMPFYDYIYNTMDKSTDELYERSLKGKEETPDAVHLTHPTTLQSIYHLRLGFASLASRPYKSKWYIPIMWPIAGLSMVLTWFYGSTFTVERNKLKHLKMQTWAIPRYNFQYGLSWERDAINDLIEKAILEADEKGVKIMSLGLLNQAKELNHGGDLYLQKYPKLKLRIVDGSSLAAAVVVNSIPSGTTQVLLKGQLSKVAFATVEALCKKGIHVMLTHEHELHSLKSQISVSAASHLSLCHNSTPKVWLIGEGLDGKEQTKAQKRTHLIPFSQFPPKKVRKDCIYYKTPAMKIPDTLENMHSCENWLPRRVMSAWRVAGIVHALEGWDAHECGDTVLEIEKVWSAALRNGFLPVPQV